MSMETKIRDLPVRLLGFAFVFGIALLAAAALLAGAAQAQSGPGSGDVIVEEADAPLSFEAELTGDQEVPAVDTATTGMAEVNVNEDMTQADFEVRVDDGFAVTQSHLHCAPAGENGPVIAFLFGHIPGGFDVDGDLAQFTLTDANILPAGQSCDTPVHDIASLTEALRDGIIYANVHTVAYPDGEIRGQLMSEPMEIVVEEEVVEEEMAEEEEMEE